MVHQGEPTIARRSSRRRCICCAPGGPMILAGHGAILSNASDEIRADRRDAGRSRSRRRPRARARSPRTIACPWALRLLRVAPGAVASPGERDGRPARHRNEPRRVGHAGLGSPAAAPSEALLHIDIDPYEVGKNYQVTVPLDRRRQVRAHRARVRDPPAAAAVSPPGVAATASSAPPPDRPRFLNAAAMDLELDADKAPAAAAGPPGGAAPRRPGLRRRRGQPVMGDPLLAEPLSAHLLLRDRHGLDGLRGGGRDRRQVRGARTGSSSRSPGTADSS